MIGRTYMEKGKAVVVLVRRGACRSRQPISERQVALSFTRERQGGPRNVLIEREDGSRVVRPFRGLRRA